MKVCFPVYETNGVDSKIYGHFGSAKNYLVMDTETESVVEVCNENEHHGHGACDPLRAFNEVALDAMVVSGIGGGALMKLNDAGVRVFQAQAETVKENLEMLIRNELPEFAPSQTCSGHGGHGSGCSQ